MARIRKFCAYRRIERPYTRVSKYRKKAFISANPHSNIVSFDMGSKNKEFPVKMDLVAKSDLQIRHNALEAARQTSNRILETNLGKAYNYRLRTYPHHVLRENPLASGAGADRMSTGMKMSFGKPISVAAQVRKGQPIFSLSLNKNSVKVGREALKRAASKLPCSCSILVAEK